eukprot:6183960-Pleurochrysis_carterae.AAC.1
MVLTPKIWKVPRSHPIFARDICYFADTCYPLLSRVRHLNGIAALQLSKTSPRRTCVRRARSCGGSAREVAMRVRQPKHAAAAAARAARPAKSTANGARVASTGSKSRWLKLVPYTAGKVSRAAVQFSATVQQGWAASRRSLVGVVLAVLDATKTGANVVLHGMRGALVGQRFFTILLVAAVAQLMQQRRPLLLSCRSTLENQVLCRTQSHFMRKLANFLGMEYFLATISVLYFELLMRTN